jgi:ATP-dependent Lhr-like helicase
VIARLHRGEKRLVFCDSRSSAEQLSSMLRGQEMRTFVSHASLSVSERTASRGGILRGEGLRHRRHLDTGARHRRGRPRPRDPDRLAVERFIVPAAHGPNRPTRRRRRNCLFLTTNDNAFMLALGVTQKWSEAWVEAAVPPAEPWHIVAQQALVLSVGARRASNAGKWSTASRVVSRAGD